MQRRSTAMALMGLALIGWTSVATMAAEREGGRAGEPRGEGRALKRLDVDGDLAITRDEYLKRRNERFQRTDLNADGFLDEAELMASAERRQKRQQQVLKRLDQDANGRITKAEFDAEPAARARGGADGPGRFATRSPERRARLFTRLDRNRDGTVEVTEAESAASEEAEYRRRKALHVLDANNDGKVTLEEFSADQRTRFDRLDLDRDGRITAADLPPEARAQWAAR